MSRDHVVELPRSVFGLKIAQVVISVLALGLDAYLAYDSQGLLSDVDFMLFVPSFSILILIYYLVSVQAATGIYNWVALLIFECLAVVFWLSSWAAMTADYVAFSDVVCSNSYNCAAVNEEIAESPVYTAFFAIWKVVIILGVINFVLYCVTLGFMASGIHRHRMAGKPMTAGGSHSARTTWADAEKNEMHNMPRNAPPAPAYPNGVQYAPKQAPVTATTYDQGSYASPVSAYSQPGTLPSNPNTHEVYGSSRYQ